MIIIDGIEMRTAAQWAKKHRAVLKRQLKKGVYRTWNTPGGQASADFYSEEQTRPYNKKELRRARKARRDLEKTRKERLSCRCCGEYFGQYAKWELNDDKLCDFCERPHTAWQWLYHKHCAPKKGEIPAGKYPKYRDYDTGKWDESKKMWYYYSAEQVTKVPDEQFEKLKELYIKTFGGWEEIDLEHTAYDGHKWWQMDLYHKTAPWYCYVPDRQNPEKEERHRLYRLHSYVIFQMKMLSKKTGYTVN